MAADAPADSEGGRAAATTAAVAMTIPTHAREFVAVNRSGQRTRVPSVYLESVPAAAFLAACFSRFRAMPRMFGRS